MSDEKLLEVVDLQAGYNGMAVVHDHTLQRRGHHGYAAF